MDLIGDAAVRPLELGHAVLRVAGQSAAAPPGCQAGAARGGRMVQFMAVAAMPTATMTGQKAS